MALFDVKQSDIDMTMHYAKPIQKENRHMVVHFDDAEGLKEFSELLGIRLTTKDTELYYDVDSPEQKQLFASDIESVEIPQPVQEWEYWVGMPEYISYDKQGYHMIYVYFKNKKSKDHFIELMHQQITETTKYIWFPYRDKLSRLAYTWVVE